MREVIANKFELSIAVHETKRREMAFARSGVRLYLRLMSRFLSYYSDAIVSAPLPAHHVTVYCLLALRPLATCPLIGHRHTTSISPRIFQLWHAHTASLIFIHVLPLTQPVIYAPTPGFLASRTPPSSVSRSSQ